MDFDTEDQVLSCKFELGHFIYKKYYINFSVLPCGLDILQSKVLIVFSFVFLSPIMTARSFLSSIDLKAEIA